MDKAFIVNFQTRSNFISKEFLKPHLEYITNIIAAQLDKELKLSNVILSYNHPHVLPEREKHMFRDRREAAQKLAKALEKYKDKDALVLAIPRGGVEVGSGVAKYLKAEFSIIISRKLPFPDNPEAGFGAIAEDGSVFMVEEFSNLLPEDVIEEIIGAEIIDEFD